LVFRLPALIYALVAYAVGMGALILFGAFLLDFDFLPRSASPVGSALAIDLALIVIFGVQHSVMARPAFKRVWTRIMPRPVERATFVLASAIVLGAVVAFWRPMEGTLWNASGAARIAAYAIFGLGALVLVGSTFMIDHLELLGLRQVWEAGGRRAMPSEFRVVLLYRVVRHPIMLGFLIVIWAAPRMTLDHLVLSLGLTAYILVGMHFEERDLLEAHGDDYRRYQKVVPPLIPLPGAGWRDGDEALHAPSSRSRG
jgi:protein-S-isoprenylcysteine O-methyltransferase Ste14